MTMEYRYYIRLIDQRTPNVSLESWTVFVNIELEAGESEPTVRASVAPSRAMLEEAGEQTPADHVGFVAGTGDGEHLVEGHLSKYVQSVVEWHCEENAQARWYEVCDEVAP